MNFIRRLAMDISFQSYHFSGHTPASVQQLELEGTKDDFEQKALPLAEIGDIKHIHCLELSIALCICPDKLVTKFEEVFYPLMYDLQDMDAKVRVTCRPYIFSYNEDRITNFDGKFNFDRPRSEWDEKVQKDFFWNDEASKCTFSGFEIYTDFENRTSRSHFSIPENHSKHT
jgi:hypothetical protein